MRTIIFLSLTLIAAGAFVACGGTTAVSGDTPTEAYKRLYAAVKKKDTEAIKLNMSKKTLDFAVSVSQRNNTPIEKVFENGFTATTFAEALPEIRDQRISDDMGAIEVYNSKESKWEDLPFVREDNGWKLAIGDIFGGTFKSPGQGRDAKEKAAANAMAGNSGVKMIDPPANANFNGEPAKKDNPSGK